MPLTFMDFEEISTGNLIQISPKHVVFIRQTEQGIEVHLATGQMLLVNGDWHRVSHHFKEALGSLDQASFSRSMIS